VGLEKGMANKASPCRPLPKVWQTKRPLAAKASPCRPLAAIIVIHKTQKIWYYKGQYNKND